MNNTGWISLHRSLLDNDLWTESKFTRAQAWIDLLLLANRKPNTFILRGIEIHIERGQIARSVVSLANRWQWNERTVSNFLKMLNRSKMIQSKTNNVCTIITICKYNTYQNNTEQSTEQNTEQTQSRVQTNNKDNKEDNINNNENPDEFSEIKKELGIPEKPVKGITQEFQNEAIRIIKALDIPPERKSAYFKAVKDYPRNTILSSYSFAIDHPNPEARDKMFFWKLNKIKNGTT